MENGPVENVDLPIKHGGLEELCIRLPEGYPMVPAGSCRRCTGPLVTAGHRRSPPSLRAFSLAGRERRGFLGAIHAGLLVAMFQTQGYNG